MLFWMNIAAVCKEKCFNCVTATVYTAEGVQEEVFIPLLKLTKELPLAQL